MKAVKDPRREWVVYAHSNRGLDKMKPSDKQHMSDDGGDLYWLPVHVFEVASGRELDITVFSANAIDLKFLDVVQLVGPHLIEMFGTKGGNVRAMYWFDQAQVIDHWGSTADHLPMDIISDGVDDE